MKLVREHINEKFTQDSDPVHDMDIGKKVLIEKWLKKMNITNYRINNDYSIDLHENVSISNQNIKKFPEYIKFNTASGLFSFNYCNLKTLKGFPKKVGSYVSVQGNNLKSLEYAPEEIHVTLFIENNDIPKAEIKKYLKRAKREGKYICVSSNFGNFQSLP